MTITNRRINYMFDEKFIKFLCLYKLLDPSSSNIFGYNGFHITIMTMIFFIGIYFMENLIFMYTLTNDLTAFLYNGAVISNSFLLTFKIITIIHYSKDLWKCIENTNINFLSYKHYNRNIFYDWRRHSILLIYLYTILFSISFSFWIIIPIILKDTNITIRQFDGSYINNRINVFNVLFIMSEDTYNKYFYIFYVCEIVIGLIFLYFASIFDIITYIVCYALLCQLETICDGIRSLGYKYSLPDSLGINSDVIQYEEKYDIYDNLRTIITDHQKVMKQFNSILNIFQPILKTKIFLMSFINICIWYIGTSTILLGEDGNLILATKILISLPYYLYHLFIISFLFGKLNEKVNAIIFALYSCNWTDADMRTKKFVLYAMFVNNAVQPKLKFTNSKIVNLEIFASTMNICYSITSMLVNYKSN